MQKSKLLEVLMAFIDEIAIVLIISLVILYYLYVSVGNILIIYPIVFLSLGLILILMYKVIKVHMRKPKVGLESLIGKTGRVIEVIDPYGKVLIEGEIWKAKSINGTKINIGENVEVIRVEGLTLIVRKK